MKKKLFFSVVFFTALVFFACKKDKVTPRLDLLTGHIWVADSLLADGVDQGGPGGILERFNGDTKFNTDGTGYVGSIAGTWEFSSNEELIIITSDSLPIPVTTRVVELSTKSLKLTTTYPLPVYPVQFMDVRMTFKPK